MKVLFSSKKQPVQTKSSVHTNKTILKINNLFSQGVLLLEEQQIHLSVCPFRWTPAYCQPDLIQLSLHCPNPNKEKYNCVCDCFCSCPPSRREGVFRKEDKLLRKIPLNYHKKRCFFPKILKRWIRIHHFQFYSKNQMLSKAVI